MLSCSLFRGKSCRSTAKKLFRATEKLANSNLERRGGDKSSEIVFLKHFMTNQRYKEMRNSHQDCHTEVPDLSDLLKYFYPLEVEPSFWEFVQYVLAHPAGDPHWKPFTQASLHLRPDDLGVLGLSLIQKFLIINLQIG